MVQALARVQPIAVERPRLLKLGQLLDEAQADAEAAHAGAGSRRIEFGSESVLSLDRKGRPDPTGAVTVEMVLDKNRHGASGRTITVLFDGATQRFTEVDSV